MDSTIEVYFHICVHFSGFSFTLTCDHEWKRMLSVDYNCTLALLSSLLKNAILPVLHTLSSVILIILHNHSTSTRMRRFEVGVAVIIGQNNKSEAMATKLNSLSLSHITTSSTVTD